MLYIKTTPSSQLKNVVSSKNQYKSPYITFHNINLLHHPLLISTEKMFT